MSNTDALRKALAVIETVSADCNATIDAAMRMAPAVGAA